MQRQKKNLHKKRDYYKQRHGKRNHDFRYVNMAMLTISSKKRRHDPGDREASK